MKSYRMTVNEDRHMNVTFGDKSFSTKQVEELQTEKKKLNAIIELIRIEVDDVFFDPNNDPHLDQSEHDYMPGYNTAIETVKKILGNDS